MSLRRFLTRLIWVCLLPLVALAAYLAFDDVFDGQAEMDLEAANLARNFATATDNHLVARVAALQMLALSPRADSPSDWREFYQRAQGFRESFDSNVIFADLNMRMLFNTRVPFGAHAAHASDTQRPAGRADRDETGKPAVGDVVHGASRQRAR